MSGSLHVVQVGTDASVFEESPASDTASRHGLYGRVLEEVRPGSRLTYLAVGPGAPAPDVRRGNVCFARVVAGRAAVPVAVARALRRLGQLDPIAVVATQTIHEDAWSALWYRRRTGVPVVGQVHYDLFDDASLGHRRGRRLVGAARRAASVRLLGRMDAIRVVNARLQAEIRRRAPATPVEVIPVPVTTLRAATVPDRRRLPREVLFVGRLAPEKRLDRWLEVAARVAAERPDATFRVVGAGALAAEATRAAAQLGDRLRLAGPIPHAELGAVYRDAAVLLVTSEHEGFGRVAVEALAHGVPVVGPADTGLEDVVLHGRTGYLRPAGDVASLAGDVLSVLGDPALRHRLGSAGRADVLDRFDPTELAVRWMTMLVRVAERETR